MIEHPLEARLREVWPLEKWSDVRSVVAVSGGADSIGLLHAIARIATNRDNLTVAHLNHGLRGIESDQDQQFVEETCRKQQIHFETERVAIGAIARGKTRIGTESAARNLRYEFLRRTAESIGARYILMGHTADDQAETVLHNICRGTGLAGVAGIRFTRRINEAVTVVRPFLDVWRSEILSYLDHINQTYRTDSSNQSTMYTRNRIRHDVLPRLEEEINRSTRKHLVQLAQLAREASEELDRAASQLDSAIIRQTETELWLDLEKFAESSEFLIVQFLKRCWGWQEWPMRSMDSTKWQTLASGIRRASSSDGFPTIRLPGSVFATFVPNVVRFRRDTETS